MNSGNLQGNISKGRYMANKIEKIGILLQVIQHYVIQFDKDRSVVTVRLIFFY
jgi:hypothetical protein